MVVEIHLHTILQRKNETGSSRIIEMILPPGSTLAEVLIQLNVDLPEDALLFIVNGRNADIHLLLHDQDIVHIIPALSGG